MDHVLLASSSTDYPSIFYAWHLAADIEWKSIKYEFNNIHENFVFHDATSTCCSTPSFNHNPFIPAKIEHFTTPRFKTYLIKYSWGHKPVSVDAHYMYIPKLDYGCIFIQQKFWLHKATEIVPKKYRRFDQSPKWGIRMVYYWENSSSTDTKRWKI